MPNEQVPIEEVVRMLTFEVEALIRILEEKGLIMREEILQEIVKMRSF
jgi:hypothetical protein